MHNYKYTSATNPCQVNKAYFFNKLCLHKDLENLNSKKTQRFVDLIKLTDSASTIKSQRDLIGRPYRVNFF